MSDPNYPKLFALRALLMATWQDFISEDELSDQLFMIDFMLMSDHGRDLFLLKDDLKRGLISRDHQPDLLYPNRF